MASPVISTNSITSATSANPTNLAKLAVNPTCRDDPFHRYLMPALQVTQLAKNGGQTYLINAVAVAKALARPLPVLNKFFGRHFSTRSQVKTEQILCRSCTNPETVVEKDRIKCKACGYARVLA